MTKFASFRFRLLAWSLDCQISLLPHGLFLFYLAQSSTLTVFIYNFLLYLIIVFFPLGVLIPLYTSYSTVYFGGTLGKLLTGLKVTNEEGGHLTLRKSLFRHTIGYTFSGTLFGLGFWSIIKDEKSRGWHDKATGSIVIVAKTLWPWALLFSLIATALYLFLISSAVTNFTSGPVVKEVQQLLEEKPTPTSSLPFSQTSTI